MTGRLTATWSKFRSDPWNYLVNALLSILVLVTFLLVILVLTNDFDFRSNFQKDLTIATSATRTWAGLNCASPPAGEAGLTDALREIGWDDRLYEPEAWHIRLDTGRDGACTGATVLYSGQRVDTANSATKQLFRKRCARRQGVGVLGFPVRPTVITGSQGEYQLRWDASVGRPC